MVSHISTLKFYVEQFSPAGGFKQNEGNHVKFQVNVFTVLCVSMFKHRKNVTTHALYQWIKFKPIESREKDIFKGSTEYALNVEDKLKMNKSNKVCVRKLILNCSLAHPLGLKWEKHVNTVEA